MSDETVEVRIACICSGKHEDGDVVRLRAKLGLRQGLAIQKLVIDANAQRGFDAAAATGILGEAYLLHGIESWTLLDENGQVVPLTHDTIRSKLLDDFAIAAPIADMADDLYMAAVLLPLAIKASTSSRTSQTSASTSASQRGKSTRQKQSKRYSTSTIPTDGTETISRSLDGGSSSLPS